MKGAATLTLYFGLYSSMLVAADGGTQPAAEAPAAAPAATAAADAESPAAGFEGKETVCKNGNNVRKVKLGFADIKTGNDCKVSYLKETEEPNVAEKVLWNARNDAKFCQEHAQGFVEKLKGQGWSCE